MADLSIFKSGPSIRRDLCVLQFVMFVKSVTIVGLVVLLIYPDTIYRTDPNPKPENFTMRFTQMEWGRQYLNCRYPEARAVIVNPAEIDYALNLPSGSVYNPPLAELGKCFAKMTKLNEDVGVCFCNSDKVITITKNTAVTFTLFIWFLLDVTAILAINRKSTLINRAMPKQLLCMYLMFFAGVIVLLVTCANRGDLTPKMWLPLSLYETDYFVQSDIDSAWRFLALFSCMLGMFTFAGIFNHMSRVRVNCKNNATPAKKPEDVPLTSDTP